MRIRSRNGPRSLNIFFRILPFKGHVACVWDELIRLYYILESVKRNSLAKYKNVQLTHSCSLVISSDSLLHSVSVISTAKWPQVKKSGRASHVSLKPTTLFSPLVASRWQQHILSQRDQHWVCRGQWSGNRSIRCLHQYVPHEEIRRNLTKALGNPCNRLSRQDVWLPSAANLTLIILGLSTTKIQHELFLHQIERP